MKILTYLNKISYFILEHWYVYNYDNLLLHFCGCIQISFINYIFTYINKNIIYTNNSNKISIREIGLIRLKIKIIDKPLNLRVP